MNFTVYSKSGCPFCEKIKTVLTELKTKKGYEVNFYELNKDFTREEFYDKFGQGSTFPQVILDEKHIGGCTDTVKYLMEEKMF
jgi:glutaredoxin